MEFCRITMPHMHKNYADSFKSMENAEVGYIITVVRCDLELHKILKLSPYTL